MGIAVAGPGTGRRRGRRFYYTPDLTAASGAARYANGLASASFVVKGAPKPLR